MNQYKVYYPFKGGVSYKSSNNAKIIVKIVENLQELGLTDGEARVYVALLEVGKSTVGPIIKKSKISPSKVYDVLSRLVKKGIVTSVIGGKTRFYRALPPKRLKILIDDLGELYNNQLEHREKVLESVIPVLEFQLKGDQNEYAEILEGVRGIKTFFEMLMEELKPGETGFVLGYTKYAGELFDEYFIDYNERLRKKGIKARVIFEYDAWFRKKRTGRPHADYRYLPKTVKASAFIGIYHDKIGIMIVTEKQKLCILISNQEIADSYKQYFEFMWKQSINPGIFYKT